MNGKLGKNFIKKAEVLSQSMSPLIIKGDTIVYKACTGDDVKMGDIIVFSVTDVRGKKFSVVHRAIGRKTIGGERFLLQKGDVSLREKVFPIEYQHVEGRVIAIEKNDYIVDFSKLKWKIANLLFYLNAVIFEYELMKILRKAFSFLPNNLKSNIIKIIDKIIFKIKKIILYIGIF